MMTWNSGWLVLKRKFESGLLGERQGLATVAPVTNCQGLKQEQHPVQTSNINPQESRWLQEIPVLASVPSLHFIRFV
jgi:hypothetical protein